MLVFLNKNNALWFEQEQCPVARNVQNRVFKNNVLLLTKNIVLCLSRSNVSFSQQEQGPVSEQELCLVLNENSFV